MKKLVYGVLFIILFTSIFMVIGKEIAIEALVDVNEVIPILMYHHVVEEGVETNKIMITTKRFEEDMEY